MLGNNNQVLMRLQIVIQYKKEVSTVLKKKLLKQGNLIKNVLNSLFSI